MSLHSGDVHGASPNSEAKRASLQPGAVIDDRYEIEAFLGKGGMCSVYRAKHLALGRPIAIKILDTRLAKISEDSISRFQREAIAVGALDHPNIVKGYGFGTYNDAPYMAIEYLEGESVAQRLQRDGKLDTDSFVRIISGICSGLAYAHRKGIIHRDLKPSNVMLVNGDEVRIVDFGIAKLLPHSGREAQRLTQTGEVFGTLAYMSPEQCAGGEVDTRTDIYSLGCMMYELLDGAVPFTGDSRFSVLYQQSISEPKRSDNLREFAGIICACLQKAPEKRPQSVAEIGEAIRSPRMLGEWNLMQPTRSLVHRKAIALACATVVFTAISALGVFYVVRQPTRAKLDIQQVILKSKTVVTSGSRPDPYTLSHYESDLRLALQSTDEITDDERQLLRALLACVLDLERHGNFAEAVADLKINPDVSGKFDATYDWSLFMIACHFAFVNEDAQAIYWYKRQIAYIERTGGPTLPLEAGPLDGLARIYKASGQFDEAANCYRRILHYHPNDQNVRRFLDEVEAAGKSAKPADR